MAVLSSPVNGSACILMISEDSGSSYDTISFTTNATVSLSHETRDITNKDSVAWQQNAEGIKSWSMSGEGLVTYAAVTDKDLPTDIATMLMNRTEITVKFTTVNSAGAEMSDNYKWSGNAFVTAWEESGGVEDNATYSFTFTGTGALTQEAIA